MKVSKIENDTVMFIAVGFVLMVLLGMILGFIFGKSYEDNVVLESLKDDKLILHDNGYYKYNKCEFDNTMKALGLKEINLFNNQRKVWTR